MTGNDLQLYTRTDLENARTRGQVVGWIQGAGALVVVGLAFRLLGWLPIVVIGGAAAWFVYRVLRPRDR